VARITGCRVMQDPPAEDGRDYRVSCTKAVKDRIFGEYGRGIAYGVKQFSDLVLQGRVKDLEHNRYFNVKHLEGT
jgi:hypothetical protein